MSYNLKDHINEWVNIQVSIDNINGEVRIFLNGNEINIESIIKRITKTNQSKLYIGSKSNGTKNFRGKMENVSISNKKITNKVSSVMYKHLKFIYKKQIFNIDFKNTSTNSKKVFERSKYKSITKFSESDVDKGVTLITDQGKDAVNFSSGDFMEIDAGASMNGELLKNSTFTSWVKLPPTHSKSGYEPIISRENVFSFGVNNGHASLFLSQNNQLAPGTNINKTEEGLAVVDETFVRATFEQNDSLVKVNKNGVLITDVIESDMIEYSGVAKSKALKLTTNDKVEIDKLTYTGRDLSKFSMSMWMKPDQLSDNMVLFSRPEMGLALKANSSGKLNLEYNKVKPPLPESFTLAFHYGNFTNIYGDVDISTATTNGNIFENTPLDDYAFGSIDSIQNSNNQTIYNITFNAVFMANILAVAGGASGIGNPHGGGGGGGEVVTILNQEIHSTTVTIKVGNGGNNGNGVDSEFNEIIATGGGIGASWGGTGSNGGSGGGGSIGSTSNGKSISVLGGISTTYTYTSYGNDGGLGSYTAENAPTYGGGGGGAGTTGSAQNGGYGKDLSSTFGTTYGSSGRFAGGGGGGGQQGDGHTTTPGAGRDGGGSGSYSSYPGGTAAIPYTGSGGGGSGHPGTSPSNGGMGGSGIIIIKRVPIV
tara:strand:- start:3924 stop:5876 length:1953 start_codon:yes stop_codon:yes gene_type:complete